MTSLVKRIVASAIAFSIATIGLTGCSSEKNCEFIDSTSQKTTPVQISAILAPTSNFVNFDTVITASSGKVQEDLGHELPDERLKEAIGGELSIVIADGVPQRVVKNTVDPLGQEVFDIKDSIESTAGIFSLVASCAAGDFKTSGDEVPTTSESDILAALSIAADQFTNPDAKHELFILSNGIQTAGSIKMQDPGMFPKTTKTAGLLAAGLDNVGEIPDLTGVTVYWYGLGQVDGTNQVLSQKPRDGLTAFWQDVITRAGGEMKPSDILGQVGSGLPTAKSIPVTPIKVSTCKLIRLYEEDGIEFQADSASFVKPALAKATAKTVAQKFTAGECDEMTVSGFAAAGVDKSTYDSKKSTIDATNKSLTLARAKAFASLIRAAGYQGEISTEGAGTCGTEWKTNGKVDPALQKLCRRVEVSN
ncbi:MAG: hypothetical protein RLZ71_374 [Actinomycetota bacterium]|jgi:hypothetical protein